MSKEKEAYFKGLQATDRVTALAENAEERYNKSVIRYFTEDDLTEMKDRLSTVDIQMNDAEIEKKEITKEVSDRINIFKKQRNSLLRDLKAKYFENDETVYDIADQESGMMETFDSHGNIIETRRLTPKEKQLRSINLHKTA